jgi:hypothetical protein
MRTLNCVGLVFGLIVFCATQAHARAVRVLDMTTLMKESQLVFVGQVKSVKASGITTELTYPTWNDVVFEWLRVEVKVIEPIKGTKKGEVVSTLMLSTRGPGPTINPPGMVQPQVGQHHLLCLLPADATEGYAAVTAPFDDDQAIFLLDRKLWTDGGRYYKDGKEVAFQEQSEKTRMLWDLASDKGEINPESVELLRKKYAAEIAVLPPKDAVIHLKWKKRTSADGWDSNIPDAGRDPDVKKKDKAPAGPTTKPLPSTPPR